MRLKCWKQETSYGWKEKYRVTGSCESLMKYINFKQSIEMKLQIFHSKNPGKLSWCANWNFQHLTLVYWTALLDDLRCVRQEKNSKIKENSGNLKICLNRGSNPVYFSLGNFSWNSMTWLAIRIGQCMLRLSLLYGYKKNLWLCGIFSEFVKVFTTRCFFYIFYSSLQCIVTIQFVTIDCFALVFM